MTSDVVTAARDAFARQDWRAAHDALAGSRPELSTADLELLAASAWWMGDSPESMTVSEEVYQRLVAEGAEQQAADRALRLALEWFTRGDIQVGTAWLARARRMLEGLPRSVLHGYLAYFDAAADMDLSGDAEAADEAAREVEALARDFADPTLTSFALALRGMAAVRRGRTAEGFARLDEAMLPVLAGHVDPLWSGDLYCTVVHLCDELGDLARMRAWTAALARWSGPRGRTFMFASVTRIHELQLVAAEGDWDAVEHELGDRSADLVGAHGWLAGEGYYTLGEVRRLRGDADGARRGVRPRPRPEPRRPPRSGPAPALGGTAGRGARRPARRAGGRDPAGPCPAGAPGGRARARRGRGVVRRDPGRGAGGHGGLVRHAGPRRPGRPGAGGRPPPRGTPARGRGACSSRPRRSTASSGTATPPPPSTRPWPPRTAPPVTTTAPTPLGRRPWPSTPGWAPPPTSSASARVGIVRAG